MSGRPLAGIGVLVTRPEHQADELVRAIEAAGGSAYRFPVIDIVPHEPHEIATLRAAQQEPDIVVFVSANAVRHGLDAVRHGAPCIAAVGPATAAALEAAGAAADLVPDGGYDTEHLLATALLRDVAGKTVTIVRGRSGRELLAETLRARGATVQYLPVYRTEPHGFSGAEIDNLEQACRNGDIDAVIVMSVATLEILLDSLPASCIDRLPDMRLVGPSERVIQTALERLPGARLILSPGPRAADMVDALVAGLHR